MTCPLEGLVQAACVAAMIVVPVKLTLYKVPIVAATLSLETTGAKAGLLVGNCVIVSPSRIEYDRFVKAIVFAT